MNSLPKAISDRIIVMRLPLSNNKFATIISTYAPKMNYPEPEKKEYYRSLSDVVGRVRAADKLVILGDFNARVGGDHELYGPALGKFGKGSCNSNGELLLNFCCVQTACVRTCGYKYLLQPTGLQLLYLETPSI
jgi:hypothetical protein